jgi:threonine/homoserine/homoserine lactone efflux protein
MNGPLASVVIIAIVMTFSPGALNVLIASSGVQVGMRSSLPLCLGIITGTLLVSTVSVVGFASIIQREPSIQMLMRGMGTIYLLLLGWKIAHAGAPDLVVPTDARPRGFVAGSLNTVLNPTLWTMVLNAAAGSATLASSSLRIAMVFAVIFAMVHVANFAVWCSGGQFLSRRFRTARHWQIANSVLGLLVVLALIPIWMR